MVAVAILIAVCGFFLSGAGLPATAFAADGPQTSGVEAEVTAANIAEGGSHSESQAGEAGHAGGGELHDPYEETLHGNATVDLENIAEWRSSLALWTLVVFGLLLAVLWKFAWGPIAMALDRRERSIQDQIAAAQQQNEEAKRLLAQHQDQLASAGEQVRRMLDDAKRQAEDQRQRIVDEAQRAASAEKDRALQEIKAARNAALQDLAQRSVDTAVGLAGQIIKRQLNAEDHASLIGDALHQFPGQH